ncbi:putative zinc finger protein [Trypanosoma equiperdum]|uniref:RING-type domain-containing protein n=4 Tax=Trypanozoon TaxID=39700 RepID=Q388V2_TRYB2|nr:hypothetical protein, conserved [Trypanosoma brucei gambiense DAL972]XP_827780.1 hypothetical protein, conserved [Trypanosoma brucei brucei TREU927]RHW68995.1 putative zinc finger protein [Trypanosoma brucei equiperdum]SCU64239.1 predicted zinc finger protein [Trypanosoma equiperdum]EAN78668.1 hypothetical protein, conserved [Trypanosoma brucei brucei TREU927]CBH16462.1 hypothetical protein, conserved [Trypanosoma brucei gambiense DAL972]|eukprot:XP_011778726.1 hypothetical protein, conserved [Trypanosoma brucei gambiense DAL972]
MGGSSSANRNNRPPNRVSGSAPPPLHMPPHLAGQYPNQPLNAPPAAPAPPSVQMPNSPSGGASQYGVQEGQILKMLATVDPLSVRYDPATSTLNFSIISSTASLTYEVHTGVRMCVKNGDVYYMPNKPKMEPPRISLEGSQTTKDVSVVVDASNLDEIERVYNPQYPKQLPCVVVLRYRIKKSNVSGSGASAEPSSVFTEHTEHTTVDLAENVKQRVISQVVTSGGSAYVVENLYGACEENCVVGAQPEVVVGSSASGQGDDDDGLCVICLTLPKDTAVIPCRHMCLCKNCAEELVRHTPKCPVCRGPVSTLLHMPTVPLSSQV